ncbi:MAG: hypothetical protein LAP38_12185 [Acidobacteriia bacterium]|nr:hypothetical protein [Terriglobia bacterium]
MAAGPLDAMGEAYQPYVEDLDLGFRGWQRGRPSVFVSGARVEHRHRATTSRYFSREYLDRTLELNYLRFLARTIAEPRVFRRLWSEAILRLNHPAALQEPNLTAAAILGTAWRDPFWIKRRAQPAIPEDEILALGSGAVVIAPGRAAQNRPVLLVVSPYLPFPLAHGGAVRMYNLMRRAAVDLTRCWWRSPEMRRRRRSNCWRSAAKLCW